MSLGNVDTPLTVEAWDGRSLAISGIALSRAAHKPTGLAADLDPSLLEGNKPLIARSLEVTPSGDSTFRAAEPCFGYLELYDSALAGSNPHAPRLDIRVLSKGTRQEVLAGDMETASFLRPGSPIMPVIFQVPMRGLAAGAYTLEMKASLDGRTAVRTLDFQVQ